MNTTPLKGASTGSAETKRFNSFDDFYPYYLQEHAKPLCRTLHYAGTALSIVFLIAGFIVDALWFAVIPLAGYGFAWGAHFFVEKNRPATFTYPLWSLIGDYKMFFSWLGGRLPAQLSAAGL